MICGIGVIVPRPMLAEDDVMAHLVCIVGFPGVQALDVVGPHEVFRAANEYFLRNGGPAPYALSLVAATASVATESGLRLHADPLPRRRPDTLVVPGGAGSRQVPDSSPVIGWLRNARPARLVTVCTGAFVAAQAGLLTSQRVTTHWAYCAELAAFAPQLTVLPEPVYVRDGHVWSSGGVTAGMDLALAIVAEDCGSVVAQTVARWLVMFLHRPGNQSQFAAPVWLERAVDDRIAEVQRWVDANPAADHRVDVLARRASMSARHFQRLFAEQTGVSVGAYVTAARIETAKRLLTQTDSPLTAVASRSGLGTPESLRRAFVAHCGATPSEFRARFTLTRTGQPA